MTAKYNALYVGILILFLYACSDLAQQESSALTGRDIAVAYVDLEAVVDSIDTLSSVSTEHGESPPLSAKGKARMGVLVRRAKALLDVAQVQISAGQTDSNEFREGRAVVDGLSEEVGQLAIEGGFK